MLSSIEETDLNIQKKTLPCFEFHIDYHECLPKEWKEEDKPKFGGNLSVRKKERK